VAARNVLPLPAGMPFEDGAAFAFAYGTSYHALMDRASLRADETVLVLGAAGGVGSAAVQIAKAAGAKVIATASTADKASFCLRLGADHAIDLSAGVPLRDALKALTEGRGPDVVYDPVGGDLAEPAFRSFAGGSIPALPFNLSLLKGASVVGVFWGEFVRREPKAFAQDMAQLSAWYAQGLVKPAIDSLLPMAALPQAYARMASRQVMGKVVMHNG
jgi:NADPH2:quinone reductase